MIGMSEQTGELEILEASMFFSRELVVGGHDKCDRFLIEAKRVTATVLRVCARRQLSGCDAFEHCIKFVTSGVDLADAQWHEFERLLGHGACPAIGPFAWSDSSNEPET